MASDCQARGLSKFQAQQFIERELGSMTRRFRIAQAVASVFSGTPYPHIRHQS